MGQIHDDGLPHWTLETIYPGLNSESFRADYDSWVDEIVALRNLFDQAGIGRVDHVLPTNTETVRALDSAIEATNAVETKGHQLYAYIMSYVTTDSRNTEAQGWMSRLQTQLAELEKLEPRLIAWVGSLDVSAITAQSPIARAHRFWLDRARTRGEHLMSQAEEELAADLNTTGGRAWSRFYSNFSSQISAEIEIDGESRVLPMTAIRNLASEPDRDLRRRAYEVELAAWEAHAMPVAAALNSIKGQANVLNRRRRWASPLDLALFNNNIDRATLDAMLDAARTHLPDFRRYLRVKAKALSVDRCAWYDLFAPVGKFERTWTFDTARAFIVEQFGSFSTSLGNMAIRAFADRWIDAEPRDGKRGGAFCMWVRNGESRILTNFQQAYGGVSTLAHELGHAYHNLNLVQRTYLQRGTPMTLAETASTFCQIIVRNAALREATPREQLAILEADLQDSTQVVVDILSRFMFETVLFERRNDRELSAHELCDLMLDAQRETYGDGLDEALYHPYMWAVKPHYYSAVFYNFPYMFGLLFGLGIYAKYRSSPQGFVDRYESLLSATGMESAAPLADRFGIDITRPEFWESSLALIAEDIQRFERLVGGAHS